MRGGRRPSGAWIGLLAVVGLLKLAVAASLGVLADEAYHWTWSLQPVAGYYDQPPLVAWVLAMTTALAGTGPLALRVGPVVFGLAGVAALAWRCEDRTLACLWMTGLPPLFWMTEFAVPDGLLIGGSALALSGALAGGRGWLVAGLGAGLAGLAKPVAWPLLPLLVAAAPGERRSRWLVAGGLVNLGLLAPFLVWLGANDGVTLVFQVSENLIEPPARGFGGISRQIGEQLAFATPLAFLATIAFAAKRPPDRTARLAWASSVPILVGFALAGWFGPPEAHWPAPAYLGAGVGLAASRGWRHRLAWIGAVTGALGTGLLVVHALVPVVALSPDPGARFVEGEVLADQLAGRIQPGVTVWTERYQEAALVRYHTGHAASVLPGCGRRSQYDLWHERDGFVARPGVFLRPARSGRPTCADRHFGRVEALAPLRGADPQKRPVGPWDLWRVGP